MDNLAVVAFDSEAKAYQALSELKQLHAAGAVQLHEAAVVDRTPTGLVTKDAVGFDLGSGAATVSIVGLLIGFLAGPLGLLLGWLTGGLIGAGSDAARNAQAASALSYLGNGIPVGGTALIAALSEPTTDALDAVVKRLDGKIIRQPAEAVQAAIATARVAESAAREAAQKAMHAEKKDGGDWHHRWEDVKASLKRTFSSHA